MPRDGVGVRASGLRKTFDDGLVQALVDVDLEIAPGERLAIMGPTGSGKSTLLALLAMLDSPDAGEIELDGESVSRIRCPEEWRAVHLGIVFQFHHLLAHLTAVENVMLPLIGSGGRTRDIHRKAQNLLDSLGLGHRTLTRAAHLSGGERQITAVARALVNDPKLVLADEPTGSVDSATGEKILEILDEWSGRRGGTLVMVTHDPTVASWSDRIVSLRDGRAYEGRVHCLTQPTAAPKF
ncbi:MAG: ABC transporter ATP-binding protein [Thermoanaerobaculales bacterium]|nr:ABC transporter ATP-binding protein [Thermoanaerobaculales bacterium]